MLQTVVLLRHEEDPFIVVRSEEKLNAVLQEIEESPIP
jgi:hypothetical protein